MPSLPCRCTNGQRDEARRAVLVVLALVLTGRSAGAGAGPRARHHSFTASEDDPRRGMAPNISHRADVLNEEQHPSEDPRPRIPPMTTEEGRPVPRACGTPSSSSFEPSPGSWAFPSPASARAPSNLWIWLSPADAARLLDPAAAVFASCLAKTSRLVQRYLDVRI